jgi:predicted membrane-bound spermidine synthase
VNTVGAILGSLLIPFVLMPLIGSPNVIVLLALTNVAMGVGLALVVTPRRPLPFIGAAIVTVLIVVSLAVPGAISQPTDARLHAVGGTIFDSTEDEIASVVSGQVRPTPELWVAGTSMTLLTVDAKLMPILPLAARPDAQRALVVAFGMGTAFRASLIAGLQTDVVELVPSVPSMFQFYYPDAEAVLADPMGRVFITDGRNHLELTTDRFDIIVTDPPPPIESSGAAVISSLEYYQAGHDHLTPGGVMMQWVPYGAPESEFKEHIRTFATVYPHVTVIRGAGDYGVYMLGSDLPMDLGPDAIRTVLARPGVLSDVSSAYDSPTDTVEGWVAVIDSLRWLDDSSVATYVGDGPLITDDRPRPEYFLLRRIVAGTLP